MASRPRLNMNEMLAIFLAAGATLLFEVTITKIFEFMLWANYAYLVISTAMFGLGLSGVILTRWPGLLRRPAARFLSVSMLGCAITMFTGFLALNNVPVHLPQAPDGWLREMLNVAVVFISLGVPFVFFGATITFLLHCRGKRANAYYFADLIGAGIGAFVLVPLIPIIEPQGLVALCCIIALLSCLIFALSGDGIGIPSRMVILGAIVAVVAGGCLWVPRAAEQVPIKIHISKRRFAKDLERDNIETTGWSALSRVDIAKFYNGRKRVWIAGGVNESSIVEFDGDYEALRSQREDILVHAAQVLDHKALPYLSKTNATVCMIGTSGGEDSMYALMLGARKVVGVEMDPTIVKLVTETYRDFAGGLFTDGDYSEIIVDEGRSYLQRCDRTFDVIQQVNNFTPIAFQNGALNLSETYLLTAESFKEFYDHLSDDGILAISRYGSVRLLTTAVEMFRRMGMRPEEYSKHLVVCQGSQWVINSILIKKSAFTKAEVERLFAFYEAGSHNRSILYAPYYPEKLPAIENNIYYQIATSSDPKPFWRVGCFDFSPATDQKPFFNRMKHFGRQDRHRERLAMLPGEILHVEPPNIFDKRVPRGDLPPLIILFEALLLSSVFFGLPMLSKRELRKTLSGSRKLLGFFACIGVAFIVVEICLIQKLVLFLGAPVYSIATVLCSLLISAGLGSLASGRIPLTTRAVRILMLTVAAVVLGTYLTIPLITRVFLGSALPVRICVALLFTGVSGFFMGMPMPTGIRMLSETRPVVIPWAWAANGFFTVIGSAGSVLIASAFGFTAIFVAAAAIYALAPVFLTLTPETDHD